LTGLAIQSYNIGTETDICLGDFCLSDLKSKIVLLYSAFLIEMRGQKQYYIVPPNKPCQKSRSIFSVGRIEKGTDFVRI